MDAGSKNFVIYKLCVEFFFGKAFIWVLNTKQMTFLFDSIQ